MATGQGLLQGRAALVSFKSSFSVVQARHTGIMDKPIRDNVTEVRTARVCAQTPKVQSHACQLGSQKTIPLM